MAANTIFTEAVNAYLGKTGRTVYAYIKVGSGAPNQYLITGDAQGAQVFRTQHDVAVDGTQYMLTAGRGKGGFQFTIFEGPICNANADTFASKYSKLDAYSDRTIEVTYSLEAGKNTKSTNSSAVFSGVILSANTHQAVSETGVTIIITEVQAAGMWR